MKHFDDRTVANLDVVLEDACRHFRMAENIPSGSGLRGSC